ncbi:MAG: IPT/TIG domain-containing protein, partial [Myxococcaceae bacterium]|nr:IPT/TIG domain-containing protein [Myxococcaceae bacterium]
MPDVIDARTLNLIALWCAAGLLAFGCAPNGALPAPTIHSVSPAEVEQGQRIPMTITGTNFFVRAYRRLGERVTVDETFVVRVGEVALDAVVRHSDTELVAEIPEDIPPGRWALTVEGPTGTTTLNDALTVRPAGCDSGCVAAVDAGADGGAGVSDAGVDAGCSGCPFPFVPSNFDPAAIAPPTKSTDLTGCATGFNSTDDTWVNPCSGLGFTVTPITLPGGGEARVLATRDLSLPNNAIIGFFGSRPVILAVYGNATIDGTILANSSLELLARSGAGADPPVCATRGGGSPATKTSGGGGGGGFGTAGGNGGAGVNRDPGGAGGAPVATIAPEPLRGGCPGGAGGGGAPGGSGGGALQVTVAGRLTLRGRISASAVGGEGGTNASSGGGGGGSGGMLL